MFDRSRIHQKPLAQRYNKVHIADIYVKADAPYPAIPDNVREQVVRTASYIFDARSKGSSVMLSFGAHSIKNGLGPLMVKFIENGWITHLATNGAGIIHDWEFAFQGQSSESVADNLPKGEFGIWEETGFSLNMAIIAGAYLGLGYGAAVGKAICEQGIMIPSMEELDAAIKDTADLDKAGAAADFKEAIIKAGLEPGWKSIPAPFGQYSLQAGAYRLGVASTDHPMFGHDIIYTHYLNSGSAIGRAAERDFTSFVHSASGLNDGVYLSLGSAIMSPMVFEKAYPMVQNVMLQNGKGLSGLHIAVVDIADPKWDWNRYSPATLDYVTADNRAFLLALYKELSKLYGYGQ